VFNEKYMLLNFPSKATTSFIKKYRQFNIKNITPGDDYAAMNQAVFRRYSHLLKDKKPLPDVVFIDGGQVLRLCVFYRAFVGGFLWQSDMIRHEYG
jgi:hypothetical protein